MKTHYFMAIYASVLFGISACDKPLPSSPESNPPAADFVALHTCDDMAQTQADPKRT